MSYMRKPLGKQIYGYSQIPYRENYTPILQTYFSSLHIFFLQDLTYDIFDPYLTGILIS